jgi:hypothetical protein
MQLLVVFLLCLVVSSALYWLIVNFWLWLLLAVGLVLLVRFAWPRFCAWLELRQVRAQTRQSIQRQEVAYDEAQNQMTQLALKHHLRKGITP